MPSYAAEASRDTTVRAWSWAHLACTLCTKASRPARLPRAYWCGRQAASSEGACCCASVRAVRRRRKSPTTNPRVPPVGLRSATIRPSPTAARMTSGTRACARSEATSANACVDSSASNTTRTTSAVNSEGPGAAPFTRPAQVSEQCCTIELDKGRRTPSEQLRVNGFVRLTWSANRVGKLVESSVSGAAVSACRAADSSPR